MKVFITGATGYIGSTVAKTLRNAGHQVFGLTRSEDKANLLLQNEIKPVIGSLQNPKRFINVVQQCDVIIHAAVDYVNNTAELDKNIVEQFIEAAKQSSTIKKLIYTSGTWVYGSSDKTITEESNINPIKVVEWRPEIDKLVINNPIVNGIVIRPGCVYGKQGGMTNDLFDSVINKHKIEVVGDGTNHWPMVHVDDLASAYLLATESDVTNKAYNIVEGSSASINEIISGVKNLINSEVDVNHITLDEAINKSGDFAEALALNQKLDNSKPREELGWKPSHRGFYQELDQYYSTWKAYQIN